MKISIQTIKKIFRSNKGETLVESIVSLLILSVLLLAVTTMIQTALRMTSASAQKARGMQEDTVNPVILADYRDSENDVAITFEATAIEGEHNIEAKHNVVFNQDGGLIAFSPAEEYRWNDYDENIEK